MMASFWDCIECGTKNIMGLDACPQCRKPRPPEDAVTEAPAALDPESGTQEDEAVGTVSPEPQVKTGGRKSDAKSK